ncbi:MAG TPA: ABC transporter ATP-binding protein, partial [Vicinamibacterales bacterium]|nr:ABC transporter ATP-binding protein [Vicinamibacterales bacterium]
MNAIELTNVTKVYRKYARRKQFATLKSALLSGSLIHDLEPDETFPALQGVSFNVPAGRTYGVIGRNGSGKSTALKLVAGITKPTSGTVKVDGRISALIELGAGFHPEISGRENVFINGIMLGLTKREIAKRFDEIVEFAELQRFIDAPVKTYSSGMYMRLGFAVAVHVDPDVLLVDEVLAVGDEGFTHKCLDKFGEFKRRGKTILLVTHSLDLVQQFCDEALWLDHGKVRGSGDPRRVVDAYRTDVGKSEERELARADARAREGAAQEAGPEPSVRSADLQVGPSNVVEDMTRTDEGRWGSREIEITGVTFKTAQGETSHIFQSGEPMSIHLSVRAHQPTTDFVFGIGLYSADGVNCFGTNTHVEDFTPQEARGEGEVVFRIDSLDLVEGTYKLDVAVHKRDGYPYDYHRL